MLKNYFVTLEKLPFGMRLLTGLLWCLSLTTLFSIQKISQYSPKISTIFYLFFCPAIIISGFFAQQLKNPARMAIIVLSILGISELVLSTPSVINNTRTYFDSQYKKMSESFDLQMRMKDHENAARTMEIDKTTQDFMVSLQCWYIVGGIIYSILLYLSSIIYLTRPRIRRLYV